MNKLFVILLSMLMLVGFVASTDPYSFTQTVDPNYGGTSRIAPSGAQETAELIRLVGGNFESGGLNPNVWNTQLINSGTATTLTGQMVLSTNTQVDGEARVQTFKRSRFITGTFNKTHFAMQYSPTWDAVNVVREFGFYDPVANIFSGDGVFLRNDSGVFTIVRRKAGVEVETVTEASFNGLSITRSPTSSLAKDNMVHIYEFQYNAGRIDLIQDGHLIHRMLSLSAVAYETVHLPISALVRNKNGNSALNELKSRGFSNSRIGSLSARPESFRVTGSSSGVIKNSPGSLHKVLITNVGNGQATITLYDNPTGASGTIIDELDVTVNLIDLGYGLDFNDGLSFSATGTNIGIIIIYD